MASCRGISKGTLGALLLTLAACSGGDGVAPTPPAPPAPTVAQVEVLPGTLTLVTGATGTLAATPRSANGAAMTRAVTWSSDNAAVASVSTNGVVTAIGVGTVAIAATADGVRGAAQVTVRAVPVGTVGVALGAASVFVGATLSATATVRDSLGAVVADRPVTWTSANPAIATVSSSGVVTALQPGTTIISAQSEGKVGGAALQVRLIPVGTLTVTLASSTINPGATTPATVVVRDSLGAVVNGRTISWSTGSAAVATVSAAGVVTGVQAGTTTIIATSEGKSGTATISVVPIPVASVALAVDNVGITPGATTTVVPTVRSASGAALTGRTVTYTNSAPGVVSLSAAGVVTGLTLGSAQITATCEGRTSSIVVQVRAPLQPWVMRDSVAVVELNSVYDAHPAPDPITYPNMRVQPAAWNMTLLFQELEKVIVPTNYDFVLLFNLREIPAWINSGARYMLPATNVGLANFLTFTRPAAWSRLRSAPHMNWIDFFDTTAVTVSPQQHSTIAHEIGHFWGVYSSNSACAGINRLTEWVKGTHFTACLAAISSHWTYLWTRPEGGGLLLSGASNPRFNEFDLYLMGLMGYNEVRTVTHTVREDRIPTNTAPVYPITIDSLIAPMIASGANFCTGNCRRIPDTDPTAQSMRALVVIVKGADETITESRRRTSLEIARTFGAYWNNATYGRSTLSLQLVKKP